jgi:membrane-associated phospholipid phosphatase
MIASLLYDLDWVIPLRQDWLTPVFKGFTLLGFTEFFFAAFPLLYWCWNKEAGSRIAILTLISAMVVLFCKELFHDPRPPLPYALDGIQPKSFGLPSGHTVMAIVFWGSLALETGKRWTLALALFLIVGIAFSRLYLGAHDLEDVLGGAILGFLLLATQVFRKRFDPGRYRDALLFLIPFLLLLAWPNGSPPGKMILATGFYTGWLIGRKMEIARLHFLPARGWKIPVAALAGFGILFLMAYTFRVFLSSFAFPGETAPALGGAFMGFASTVAVPWFLVKLRLLNVN